MNAVERWGCKRHDIREVTTTINTEIQFTVQIKITI